MEVVDVPQSKPIITEIKTHYRIGDLVRGNCSSPYSRPATNLTWLLNDQPVMIKINLKKQKDCLSRFSDDDIDKTIFPRKG